MYALLYFVLKMFCAFPYIIYIIYLYIYIFFEAGSHFVAQGGLKLKILSAGCATTAGI
jgi:hypothetical protein